MLIESNQNLKYKSWSKLKQKKYRNQLQEFIVEGEHLVLEALNSGVVKDILICEGFDIYNKIEIPEQRVFTLTKNLYNKLAMTENPQPMMAVCNMKHNLINQQNRLILLDRIQDPGNLGTLIRSAVAFGFDGIILGEGCVDLYNEKVIRSTQGAIFKIAIEQQPLLDYLQKLQGDGVQVLGTSLENGHPLSTIQNMEKMAFIFGNEGQGVDKSLLKGTNQNIFIEMTKNTESLNVSIAGSIIMYEFRQ